MNKLICEKCGTANESGTVHCWKCGGKLAIKEEAGASKAARGARKVLRKVLIVVGVLLILPAIGLCLLFFSTSGFPEAETRANDARAVDRFVRTVERPYATSIQLSESEATLLAGRLLEKGGADSGKKVEIFLHNDRNTVSAALYSNFLGFIPSRCELGFLMKQDDEPELKFARFGKVYLPGFLKYPVVKYFEFQALKGDNKKLPGRVERVIPRGKDRIMVKLEKE